MTIKELTLLQCDGIHGAKIYSTTGSLIAHKLDGWTTVKSGGLTYDFCPHCSVSHWVLFMCQLLEGLPSCSYAMAHQIPTMFLYDLYDEDFSAWDVDQSMISQRLAWGSF